MGREDSGEALLRLVIFNRRPILNAAGKPASEKGQPGETPKNSANGQKTFKIHGSRNFYPRSTAAHTITWSLNMASTTNRDRRSAFERRCLSKAAKRLFRNNTKGVRKAIYAAECHQRNKPQLGAGK
jgi:hypothetical protein